MPMMILVFIVTILLSRGATFTFTCLFSLSRMMLFLWYIILVSIGTVVFGQAKIRIWSFFDTDEGWWWHSVQSKSTTNSTEQVQLQILFIVFCRINSLQFTSWICLWELRENLSGLFPKSGDGRGITPTALVEETLYRDDCVWIQIW